MGFVCEIEGAELHCNSAVRWSLVVGSVEVGALFTDKFYEEPLVYIRRLEIEPRFRHRGFATKLMNAVINHYGSDNIIRLECEKELCSFYHKFLFREIDKDEHGIITMELPLVI